LVHHYKKDLKRQALPTKADLIYCWWRRMEGRTRAWERCGKQGAGEGSALGGGKGRLKGFLNHCKG